MPKTFTNSWHGVASVFRAASQWFIMASSENQSEHRKVTPSQKNFWARKFKKVSVIHEEKSIKYFYLILKISIRYRYWYFFPKCIWIVFRYSKKVFDTVFDTFSIRYSLLWYVQTYVLYSMAAFFYDQFKLWFLISIENRNIHQLRFSIIENSNFNWMVWGFVICLDFIVQFPKSRNLELSNCKLHS